LIVDAVVTNTGTAVWLPSGELSEVSSLGTHLCDALSALLAFDSHVTALTTPSRLERWLT
jgi:hypothetical protein